MNELEAARNEISRIDKEMAKLFEQRMHAAAAIAGYKSSTACRSRIPCAKRSLSTATVRLLKAPISSHTMCSF